MKSLIWKIYILNLALLITHEIDSAFWHEWDLFRLPGGIQFFLVINFLLIMFFLIGIEQIMRFGKYSALFLYALSISGIIAFIIHLIFILSGFKEFLLPVSLIVLLLIFAVSVFQLILTIRIQKNL